MNFETWQTGLSSEIKNALELFGATWTTAEKKAVTDALNALSGKKATKRGK